MFIETTKIVIMTLKQSNYSFVVTYVPLHRPLISAAEDVKASICVHFIGFLLYNSQIDHLKRLLFDPNH